MNPILDSVYGAVLPAAPYVIAAYALIWVILFVFVAVIARGIKKNDADIALLRQLIEDELPEKADDAAHTSDAHDSAGV